MAKKSSESFRRVRQQSAKKLATYVVTPQMRRELTRLASVSESKIDLSDPDMPDVSDWDGFVRGKFYRPVKEPVTIRIDSDVLAWFKSLGGKYQTQINRVLRGHMLQRSRKHAA